MRIQQLEEEWTKQEIQREQASVRRQKDIAKLEKKLKEALFDVEKQEKRLKLGEEELEKRYVFGGRYLCARSRQMHVGDDAC